MRRIWLVLGIIATSGCAALSGLDALRVDDGGLDVAPGDASSDGGTFDAPTSGDGACAVGPLKAGCFGLQCTATCCVSTSTYQLSCVNNGAGGCTPATAKLGCTSPADCAGSDAGSACCLKSFSSTSNTCPLVVQASQGTQFTFGSACTIPDGCLSTSGQSARMCTADTDCQTGQRCDEAALGDAGGPTFGLCR